MCIYIITIYVLHTSKKNFFLHLESRNVNFTVKIQGWIHVLSFFYVMIKKAEDMHLMHIFCGKLF